MLPLLFCQVYCVRDNQILLIERKSEPNLGLWVAPGGKIEKGESPYDCAIREFNEETGLLSSEIHFRGMISLVLPQVDCISMQFLFFVPKFTGDLIMDNREGNLKWWSIDEIPYQNMPEGISRFFLQIIDLNRPFYNAKYIYDREFHILDTIEYQM